MNEIKAIETRYNGYRFRSRLEARWAVFFDTLGIKYEYEPEGFVSNLYNEQKHYLPDFYLTESDTWVEVKGDPKGLCKKWEYMVDLLDFGGCLPNFKDSYGSYGKGLLLLGSIPEGREDRYYIHPILQHHEGIIKNWCYFDCMGTLDFDLPGSCIIKPVFGLETGQDIKDWEIETKEFIRTQYYPNGAHKGYYAARSARFEHGETPVGPKE
jgi:hypothetical protein